MNHFCDPRPIFMSEPIFEGEVTPLLVMHDHDDSWSVLPGGSVEGTEPVIAWVTHVTDVHPSLAPALDLPIGWEIWRDTVDGPWRRAPFDELD